MTGKTIRTLKITNYKSIDSLEIRGLSPFSVFAGPNGSGKSNFFDALDFVSLFVRNGVETALRAHGGFANIHSEKRYKDRSRKFSFEIECDLPDVSQKDGSGQSTFHYSLSIHELDESPMIEEHLKYNGEPLLTRHRGETPVITSEEEKGIDQFPKTYSALLLFLGMPLAEL